MFRNSEIDFKKLKVVAVWNCMGVLLGTPTGSSYAQVDSTENIITFRVISIVGASSEDPGTSVPFD